MAYRNSNEAYDLDYFETRVPLPKQQPRQQPVVKPKTVSQKKAQKKKQAREEARAHAMFRVEIAFVAAVLLCLVAFVLYGKVQTAEEVIAIGQQQEVLNTLKSEKTRLETELEQLLPARTVEAYVVKYLGMSTINDYQKNYIDTNAGEKVQIAKESPKTAANTNVKAVNFEVGEIHSSGS